MRRGVRLGAPLFPAAAALGASFGVLARTAHLDALAAVVMSATTFAGSAQVAAVSVLGAGGGVLAAVFAALLLNVRYAPIGITVAHAFRGGLLQRLVESQLVVDESWALSGGGGSRFDRRVLLGVGVTLYVAWVGGTAVGALAGQAIGNPSKYRARRRICRTVHGIARRAAARPQSDRGRGSRGGDRGAADPVHTSGCPDHRRDRRGPPRLAASMSAGWAVVLAVGVGTVGLKAVGPVGVAGRRLPARVTELLSLVAPAILAALVVTETFAAGRSLVFDARIAGLLAGVAAVALRLPLWAIVVAGAIATAAVRLIT